MRHEIILAPEAVQDFKRLQANIGAKLKDAIEKHLRNEPTKLSRSRIKRLQGLEQPQYRLRVDGIRVFYDVSGKRVEILAIITNTDASAWLAKVGKRS
jgi:mRNA-degrading endonuclease RelE of RelBE toxin-antitoxin system